MSDTGGLFPFDDAEEFAEDIVDEEEEYTIKDFEIDWDTMKMTGNIVEGLDAIVMWVHLALRTKRYEWLIFSWDYGEEYIDYFMVDMFPGKKIRESNNGKNVRKILELLFQAYEVAGEERKSFLMKMDEVAENMDYTEKINGKRTWITVRDRTREYLPQLFVW